MKAINIKVNHLSNPIGIDNESFFISWNDENGKYQKAFQIILKDNEKVLYDSQKVSSGLMHYEINTQVPSECIIHGFITLWDENEEKEESSFSFETGLDLKDKKIRWVNPETSAYHGDDTDAINSFAKTNVLKKKALEEEKAKQAADNPMDMKAMMEKAKAAGIDISKMQMSAAAMMQAKPVAKTEENPYISHRPANYLKKNFIVNNIKNARLYITAKGLYSAFINNQNVTDAVLTPGSSEADHHVTVQTYDITSLLKEGENEILVILGDGWYRSTTGVDGDRNLFGSDVGVWFEIKNSKETVYEADNTMLASNNGPVRQNDMQQGEVYDARKENITDWHPVKLDDNNLKLLGMNTLFIKEHERFEGKIITTPNNETVIDFSQNIAGYIEIEIDAHENDKITLYCGESLENGNFTQENFQDRNRHKEGGTLQCIELICKEGHNHFKPHFTIMGFQYAKVVTNADLGKARFTAIAVYSDMEELSSFECSDRMVNQLFKNSVWSMKGNFADVPTDCPTRERAGWTGDMGVFIETGLMLMDCVPVVNKWLYECQTLQFEDGKIANIAPRNGKGTFMSSMLCQSSAWGDASIIVPYFVYQNTGDKKVLKDNYDMMKKWYAFLLGRANQTTEEQQKGPYAKYTVLNGMDYGEWCEPGANAMRDMANQRKNVGTAYLSKSGKMLSSIASILNENEDADKYKSISEMASKAYIYAFTDNGIISSTHQCDYVRPVEFGILDEKDKVTAVKTLNEMVISNNYHLNTGFLSTPYLCKVLADYGYEDTAYSLLLQDSAPSWLYEVKKGANTIWETWEGINEEGKVSASLNHYSYGAISGWLLNGVCGIHVSSDEILIKPVPNKKLSYAKASYKSPLGCITSEWKYEGNKVSYHVEIPSNCKAALVLPDGKTYPVEPGEFNI